MHPWCAWCCRGEAGHTRGAQSMYLVCPEHVWCYRGAQSMYGTHERCPEHVWYFMKAVGAQVACTEEVCIQEVRYR